MPLATASLMAVGFPTPPVAINKRDNMGAILMCSSLSAKHAAGVFQLVCMGLLPLRVIAFARVRTREINGRVKYAAGLPVLSASLLKELTVILLHKYPLAEHFMTAITTRP
jgi:hypothetical protein